MTNLTKTETRYFIAFAIIALSILLGTLWAWAMQQPSCWELHNTEASAIEACEQ